MISVIEQQCLLGFLNYYDPKKIDGEFGTNTRNAIIDFQRAENLAADGIFGQQTEARLFEAVKENRKKKQEQQNAVPVSSDPVDPFAPAFWKNIRHFRRTEFKCRCGNVYCNGYPVEMKETVVVVADRVREHFNRTATVSSGLRCKQHNANVGGVYNSRHLEGKAIDFCISGFSSDMVLSYVQQQPEVRYSYAIDGNFVHMDIL